MSKWFKFILGIAISIILLLLAFRKVDFGLILRNFSQVKIGYLISSVLLGMIILLLRSYRWKQFIEEYKNCKLINFFESINIGLFFNNILPFRMGDLVQAYMVSKKTGVPKSLSLSTVLMERFIDLFPPIISIIIGSFFIILPQQVSIILSVSVLFFLITGVIFIFKFRNLILHFLGKISSKQKFWLRVLSLFKNFYSAIDNFKNVKILMKVIILTLLLWTGYSTGMLLVCYSLNINLPSIWAGYLIQAITALSVVIPSSPGYVGSWEFMGSLALSIFNVEKDKALSFALLSHFVGMLPVLIFGLIFVIKEISLVKKVSKDSIYETNQKI
ncbi:MAG: lysylphosphatidylglycerol synthase transmembrane domain-containing protein [Elusimicrobiota bacterium]|nr:lysylphosphatidylglycerol synthase transmembrane domain-containing protein [Elusimicrobiota bacterium]